MNSIYFALCLILISSFANGQLNKSCKDNNECDVSNKFQCINGFCRCKVGYRKVENNDACVIVPGTDCDKNDDCENFPGAICDENKKCTCEGGGYTAGKTECDKIGNWNDPCASHSECATRSRSDNAECKNSVCQCKEGFHETNNKQCIKTYSFEDQCSSNDDCYLIVNDQNALECTADKICKCREGFTQDGNTCKNGSAELFVLPISIMLFLIMGIIKFN